MGLFSRRRPPSDLTPPPPPPPPPQPPQGEPWRGRALRLPAAPVVANLPALADSVRAAAAGVGDAELTYRPEQLAVVDAILGSFAEPGSDTMAETVFCFGAYLGETMVRRAGGTWVEGPQAEALGSSFAVRLPSGTVANPIGRAFRRVDEGESASIPYFYEVMTGS